LISSSHISEKEYLLLAVGHYLIFEVLQLKPEKEYTVRDQLQEEDIRATGVELQEIPQLNYSL